MDLFLTTHENLIESCLTVSGIGDHDFVKVSTLLQVQRKKTTKRRVLLWKRADETQLKLNAIKLNSLFLSEHQTEKDVDKMWTSLQTKLEKLMTDHIPSKMTSTRYHQPWITTETKRLLRKKEKWYKKSKQINSQRVLSKFKNIKKECQQKCRKAHSDYVKNLVSENNYKKLWTYIKGKTSENTGVADLTNGNKIVHDPKTKADLLNDQFSSVFSKPDPTTTVPPTKSHIPIMKDIKVTRAGVLKLLLSLKEHKATGPDGIPGRLLKFCANEIADSFTLLFQASLEQGTVPKDWKKAKIVPVFKKGEKGNVENYRPISLTSISCKLLEHIIDSNIRDHLDKFKILNDAQHGFRQNRSCESQLITTLKDFSDCLNKKQQIDAILLDFS